MDAMTLAAKLTLDTSEFNSGLSQSESKMSSMAVTVGNIAADVVKTATRATVGFAKESVETAAEFDARMSEVRAIKAMSDAEFETVRTRAMELGASTKFTAKEVADGFYYMGLAGWDVNQMLAGIDSVLNLAAASGEDLGRASDIVTDALTAFGLTAEDTGHFVDVLATASSNSNTTVSMMGEAFKYLATNAGVMNYSIEDVAAALGLLANNGIKSSQAGTSLRQIINTLIAPTDKAAEAMESLGVSLFESGTDKVKPLRQVLTELRTIFKESDFDLGGKSIEEVQGQLDELDSWYDEWANKIEQNGGVADYLGKSIDQADLDEMYESKIREITNFNEEFLRKMSDIGGARGIGSLLALMKGTDEDFEKLFNAIDSSEGSAATMAAVMLDNLSGDITILKSAIEGLQIVVSDEFKEKIRGFVQTFTEEIGNLNEAFQENGVFGVFTELASWIIDGVSDSLKNPNEAQVKQFGEAIGEFIGKLVAKLATNIGEIVKGIVELGESLASGLIEGLFKGLFGDDSEISRLTDSLEKELNSIEVDTVKANGLLNYLQELVDAEGENAKATEQWKYAVQQLEDIMPGVTAQLEAEGSTLQENIDKVRQMTDEFRKQAIQQAMVNTLQKQYELLAEKGVDREKKLAERGIQEGTQKSVVDTLYKNVQLYGQLLSDMYTQGLIDDFDGTAAQRVRGFQEGGAYVGNELVKFQDMNLDQLASAIKDFQFWVENPGKENIWDTDQNYIAPDEIESLVSAYTEAGQQIEVVNGQIDGINGEMDGIKSEIATTEKAVQNITQELEGTSTGVESSGGAVVNALGELAGEIGGIHFGTGGGDGDGGGGADSSNAKGLWDVPYNDYEALLHRGEMVLTASQARQYKNGGGGDVNYDIIGGMIANAISMSMKGVNVYLGADKAGDIVSNRVNKNITARRNNVLKGMGG